MEPLTILLIIVGVVIVLFLLDLFLAGGSMTMGTMYGMGAMMGNPIGQGILLVLLAILGLMVYAVFFR
jgi:hypothetical protein